MNQITYEQAVKSIEIISNAGVDTPATQRGGYGPAHRNNKRLQPFAKKRKDKELTKD
jgi:hypothetical protein